MQDKFDVIIVGAGPAGSIAAYELSKRGYRVLILEKSLFPRYKTCGGGLTQKIFKILPFEIKEVVEQYINKLSFTYQLGDPILREVDRNVMVCVMRDRFDEFLINKALDAGARLLNGTEVLHAEQDAGNIHVSSADQKYHTYFLIGADGARSRIAGTFKLLKQKQIFLAIEAEVETSSSTLEKFKNRVHLEWGILPAGYGWIFPKNDHLSIGVGSTTRLGKYLGPYYKLFAEKLELGITNTLSYRSYQIPFRYNYTPIQKNHVLLAGDAAGLTDPLTGEGIFYAMQSGIIAAESIDAYAGNSRSESLQYEKRVNSEIMPDLIAVDQLKNMFFILLPYFHKQIKTNDRLWNAFARVLAGEKEYASFKKNFGKLRPAYPLFSQLARNIQAVRIKNYKGKKLKIS